MASATTSSLTSGPRRRKNAKKKKNKTRQDEGNTTSSSDSSSLSFSSTIFRSPMFIITIVIMLPYTLYNSYLFLLLQRPDLLSNLTPILPLQLQLRPPISVNDERQVLILGTISSGTAQTSLELARQLQLEIGHEQSETSWNFVRDGTVSWFHGIRYFPRPGLDYDVYSSAGNGKDQIDGKRIFHSSISSLCKELQPRMGFHPYMFRTGKCSLRQAWDACWRDECTTLLNQEWGCGLRQGDDNNTNSKGDDDYGDACETPYRSILHQIRNPLRTIESLVTKFCIGGVKGRIQPPFLVFIQNFFPQHDFASMSCIEASAYYMIEYRDAVSKGLRMQWDSDSDSRGKKDDEGYHEYEYAVEEASPCSIARMAGFLEPESVVYTPHYERLSRLCRNDNNNDSSSNYGPNGPMHSTANKYNMGQLSLELEDLEGGKHGSKREKGDDTLKKLVIRQMKRHSVLLESLDF